MAQIYIMAIPTAFVAAALWVGLGAVLAGRHRRWVWLILLALPLSPLINLLVKEPIMAAVCDCLVQSGQVPPLCYWMVALLVPPLTEESIKLSPVLIPPLSRWVKEKGAALWMGLFLGLGFGLSEIGYFAWSIAQTAQDSNYPWYCFTCFAGERLVVVPIHGILTAVAVLGISRGWWCGWSGYLTAVGLHALVNLGTLLLHMKLVSSTVGGLWIALPFIGLILLFASICRKNRSPDSGAERSTLQ